MKDTALQVWIWGSQAESQSHKVSWTRRIRVVWLSSEAGQYRTGETSSLCQLQTPQSRCFLWVQPTFCICEQSEQIQSLPDLVPKGHPLNRVKPALNVVSFSDSIKDKWLLHIHPSNFLQNILAICLSGLNLSLPKTRLLSVWNSTRAMVGFD